MGLKINEVKYFYQYFKATLRYIDISLRLLINDYVSYNYILLTEYNVASHTISKIATF